MTDSEFLKALTSTEAIDLTVKDQKTGRSSSRPVWFVMESEKLYLLPMTGSDSEWYKNILVNAEVQISARSPLRVLGMKGRKLTANTKPIQASEVADVVQKFKSKYGAAEISKTYSKLDAAVQVLI
ncbi:MAG: nitroreductase/quinone reductase family protein [Candidatus Bathyarchaeia archaeon]|jgi:hypothetical protein